MRQEEFERFEEALEEFASTLMTSFCDGPLPASYAEM